jgi:galactokinase
MKGLFPMTKAKRVLSTPRKTASKNQTKKRAKSVESEEQRNLRHAEAFRDLETPVRELYLMGEIAAEAATGMHEDQTELLHFSVYRLCETIRDFRAKYRADLHEGLDRGKAVQS